MAGKVVSIKVCGLHQHHLCLKENSPEMRHYAYTKKLWGTDAPGIEIIEKYIKPKHIILGHFSIGNKDGEVEVFQTIEKLKDILPGVTILEESMQNIIIKIN